MNFKSEITLGHVLQIIALIGSGFAAYYSIDKRVSRLEFLVLQNQTLDAEVEALADRVLILEQS